MFNIVKGWPTGLGGAIEENIAPPAAVLAAVTFEGAALVLENGAWALADATDLTLANQVASPAGNKQNIYSMVFALDKYMTNSAGQGAYDVATSKKVPVISGDFVAELDTDVCPTTLPTKGQFLTIAATDGKLAVAGAASNVPVVAICMDTYSNESGISVARCRFFTPKYITIS